jgi:hypothetical protein
MSGGGAITPGVSCLVTNPSDKSQFPLCCSQIGIYVLDPEVLPPVEPTRVFRPSSARIALASSAKARFRLSELQLSSGAFLKEADKNRVVHFV